jgi:hypothetical protein
MITNIAAYNEWKQKNLSTYLKDMFKSDVVLARSLGTIQLPSPENPRQHAFNELSSCHREVKPVALVLPAAEKKSLYTSWSTMFARKPKAATTDAPKDEPKHNKNP